MAADLAAYLAMAESPEFRALKRRHRTAVFTVTGLAILWYLAFVLVAVLAPGFMSTPLIGSINVGLVFGLLQFVSTFAIAIWYVSWTNRRFDPAADALRAELERTPSAVTNEGAE